MIEPDHPELSIGRQCRLVSISRSSFYYSPLGETDTHLSLMLKIDKQFLDTPFYGVRQMTWHLRNEGHPVNEKRIRRLMRLMGLMPIYQAPNTSTPAKGHKTYPYLLRGLRVDRPNQVWCADITLASGKQSTGLFSYPPHPDAARVPLSGGDHGLAHAQGAGMAHLQHPRGRRLR
jgi:putative transposase